jgi:hypothetical protein
MTFITESQIFIIAQTRGCESRADSILRSYFHMLDCHFIGRSMNGRISTLLFKRNDFGLVLSVPLDCFAHPSYARVLIQRQIEIAERERRAAQEEFAKAETLSALKSEIQETEAVAVAVAGQGDA